MLSIDNHSQYLDNDSVYLCFRSPTKESPCIQGSDYSSPPVPFYFLGRFSLRFFQVLGGVWPPSLFSPPNFVVQRVDRQGAVRPRTRGGNRNWTAGSGHNHLHTSSLLTHQGLLSLLQMDLVVWRVALARTHTRVALCPVSRTQLGWVSAFNPLGGARSLSRKACIHLRPRKAVGFVSGCVTDCGPRGQTDGLD